jgi:hypothetical protein
MALSACVSEMKRKSLAKAASLEIGGLKKQMWLSVMA